jgi:hypothetical protein
LLLIQPRSHVGPDTTTLLAGQSAKSFTVHTDLLTSRSPYFRTLLANANSTTTTTGLAIITPPLHFPDLDEFSVALFVRWLYGAPLSPPTDFHAMQHHIGLYILALQFRVERLANRVLDLVRAYYRSRNLTAPAYRLDFVYEHTQGACALRRFLVGTAAYRVLAEQGVGGAMRGLVYGGGELAVDLVEAVVRVCVDGMGDVRTGPDCAWHEHVDTAPCKGKKALEGG